MLPWYAKLCVGVKIDVVVIVLSKIKVISKIIVSTMNVLTSYKDIVSALVNLT